MKRGILNLERITKIINRYIVISFLLVLVSFITILSITFVSYKKYERGIITQRLGETFSAFTTEITQKLITIATPDIFVDYLHLGEISRKEYYSQMLIKIHKLNLDVISGMDIYDGKGTNIFSYGGETKDWIVLDLCYLNGRYLNFKVGNCTHTWKLYFNNDAVIKELSKINPELIPCNNCAKEILTTNHFGIFPVREFANMKVNIDLQNTPTAILWILLLFVSSTLLILVVWNISKVKSTFRKYLSKPLVVMTNKIKNNEELPLLEIEELSYLAKQMQQWKEQLIDLEKIKLLEKTREEKIKTMQSIGASIAHELRTPLRSIISGIKGIEKILPQLLKSYDLATKANLTPELIKPHQLELLHKVLKNLKSEGMSANTIIDMFLMKIKGNVSEASEIKKLFISICVQEAIERYSFQKSEKSLINYEPTKDFQFKGDKILVVHILFNLLKNALYYIASAKKGQIYIHFDQTENENILSFKDTGSGIIKETLPHIFDKFYSRTAGGVGIGLSFCKMAMEWMGGDITCQSIAGEYTEFVLHFPITKE